MISIALVRKFVKVFAPEYYLAHKPPKGLTKRRHHGHTSVALQGTWTADPNNRISVPSDSSMEVRLGVPTSEVSG
jgi:hypothetical protein